MAKWIMGKGLNRYIEYLQKINAVADEVIGEAVYEMAKVVADKARANIQALDAAPKGETTYKVSETTIKSRLSEEQKKGLLDGFGVSPMQDDSGYRNVKLGFDGYNSIKTKKYPKGQPNALIARVTESGSSYREKAPFMRPAVNASKKPAEAAGRAKFDERIAAIPQK